MEKQTTLSSLDAPTCSLLDGLSDQAKQWLEKACEQAADSQGITLNVEARKECELAGLIEVDRRQWINIRANVMDAVYSNGYLRGAGNCFFCSCAIDAEAPTDCIEPSNHRDLSKENVQADSSAVAD